MAADMRYAASGMYGSAAYDLNRYGNTAVQEEYELPQEETREDELRQEKLRHRSEAIREARRVQSVSVAAVLGFLVVGVLVVLIMLSYIKLTEISGEINTLEGTLSEIETEQTKLKVEYESVFNLTEIKAYATNVLGMTKLTDSNTTVVTVQREDKAEILSDNSSGTGIIETAKEFISSLMEYLR